MYNIIMYNAKGQTETMVVKGFLKAIRQNKQNRLDSLYNGYVKGFISTAKGFKIGLWCII